MGNQPPDGACYQKRDAGSGGALGVAQRKQTVTSDERTDDTTDGPSDDGTKAAEQARDSTVQDTAWQGRAGEPGSWTETQGDDGDTEQEHQEHHAGNTTPRRRRYSRRESHISDDEQHLPDDRSMTPEPRAEARTHNGEPESATSRQQQID